MMAVTRKKKDKSLVGSFINVQPEFRLVTMNMIQAILTLYKYILLYIGDGAAADMSIT